MWNIFIGTLQCKVAPSPGGIGISVPWLRTSYLFTEVCYCRYGDRHLRYDPLRLLVMPVSRHDNSQKLKTTALDRRLTDRISLIHDIALDLQSPVSYRHDLLTCKSSGSTAGRFRS